MSQVQTITHYTFSGLRPRLTWLRCMTLTSPPTRTRGRSSWSRGTRCSRRWRSPSPAEARWWVLDKVFANLIDPNDCCLSQTFKNNVGDKFNLKFKCFWKEILKFLFIHENVFSKQKRLLYQVYVSFQFPSSLKVYQFYCFLLFLDKNFELRHFCAMHN